VGIGQREAGGFGLAVRLDVTIPSVPREQAQALLEAAHAACPYSNSVRGNIDVELTLA
jgi:lipoyl-dependent peroxiredoxin